VRALVFTDANIPATVDLVGATLRLAAARSDLEVCAIVTARPRAFRRSRSAGANRLLRAGVVAVTNPGRRFDGARHRRLSAEQLRHRHGAPVITPTDGGLNGPGFRARLTREFRPDIALTYYCGTIFKQPLLDLFDQVVNYHDGLLPAYRGVGATSFSIYAGESQSGFVFHRMVERIDAGPVLVQGAVPVDHGATLADVVRRKIVAAVAALPTVIDRVMARDPGTPPVGRGSYFSLGDVDALRIVERPHEHTARELQRRIRAFGTVYFRIAGVRYPVTRLRAVRSPSARSIRTVDGALLVPDRCADLPMALFDLGRRIRSRPR
jgi:methionyl-tRNA formyltransferase